MEGADLPVTNGNAVVLEKSDRRWLGLGTALVDRHGAEESEPGGEEDRPQS